MNKFYFNEQILFCYSDYWRGTDQPSLMDAPSLFISKYFVNISETYFSKEAFST